MRHLPFQEAESYSVAVLVKSSAFSEQPMRVRYAKPLEALGLTAPMIAFTLEYEGKKVSVKFVKQYLAELLPVLKNLGVQYLYCTDPEYFKQLARVAKTTGHLGYVLPCRMEGYEDMKVVLGLNYQQLIYDPKLQEPLDLSLQTLASDFAGTHEVLGTGIIHKAIYPEGTRSIQEALNALLAYPELACDIEAFSLHFAYAGVATIAFAPDKHRFVAFPCDYKPNILQGEMIERREEYGRFVPNPVVRTMLREFFENYTGTLTFHNASYDVKVLIATLWMEDLLDTKGMLKGLDIMCRRLDDTKIIAYLATNSTAGNTLGLKHLAHEFAGNYAVEEIKDVRKIPLAKLLQYNGVDTLSTNYVKEKYTPLMVQDQQENIYRTLLLPSQKVLIQTELTGMPLSQRRVQEVKKEMEALRENFHSTIMSHPIIATFEQQMTEDKWIKDYEERRAKAVHPDNIKRKDRDTFAKKDFNPNSDDQKRTLLYDVLLLPVIDRTDSKMPATGAETLEKLINHAVDPQTKELLAALIKHGQVSKMLSTFIPAFEKAINKDGSDTVWLHGDFNIGGTVSGRLSSSHPNMQNIPAGNSDDVFKAFLGKLIKSCFVAPKKKLFGGADFNSLEDMISALTTKDPNKLKVYTDGFDGHSLRAAYYFKEDFEAEGMFIDLTDPKVVNALKKSHPHLRQKSKAPTFLLTYGGTYHGMMSNLGWPKEMSIRIEANYHDLYQESDRYVARRLAEASKTGYVEVAFGLRVRTPLIKQVLWGSKKVPYEAMAEGRTAGNAMGQSYGLLNNRAAVDFMQKVWASPYRYDIWPVAQIHDAQYYVWTDNPEVTEWVNRELIESMRWQELPEIAHPQVKLGAALDLFWPSWANPITLPNDAEVLAIINTCKEGKAAYLKEKEIA